MVEKSKKKDKDFGRQEIILPKNNIVSHKYAKCKPFIPSYEKCGTENMNLIMSGEYSRLWRKEVDKYLRERAESLKPRGFKKYEPKTKTIPKNEQKCIPLSKSKKKLKLPNCFPKTETQEQASCECEVRKVMLPEKVERVIEPVCPETREVVNPGCQCAPCKGIFDNTENKTKSIALEETKTNGSSACICKKREVKRYCLCNGQKKPELEPNIGKVMLACCPDHKERIESVTPSESSEKNKENCCCNSN